FEEVKRRKVYQVAVAYVIAGGGIIQLASAAFPAWEMPNWALRLVIVLLLIGFPIALILAWAFDITAQGIKAAPTSGASGSHLRRNVITLVAAGVVVSAAAGFFLLPRVSAHKVGKSIAVLPFESLSDEKENAYFADGIQDDVLTNLSKIGDLKVISRTSVMPYRGKTSNVREIGKALGVGAILEGSVRRVGNRVRVNVQLINADTDEHLWAEDYDRDLTDVFAIQTDLAQQIVRELQAKLSPIEKAQIERRPTENGEAYLAFVEAHELFYRPDGMLRANTEKAEQLFDRATALDPNFAGAFAGLARVHEWVYHDFDKTPARKEKARAAAETAIRLQPDLPEGHLALGFYHYYCERDYQAALHEFAIAKLSLPNSAEVYMAIGAIERRQGKWQESTANMERAASVSPKDGWILQNLADNYYATKNFEVADRTFDRAIEAAPKSFGARSEKAKLAVDWKGDLSVMEKELTQVPTGVDPDGLVTFARMQLLLLQRKFPEALALIKQSPQDVFTDDKPREFFEGAIHIFSKDKEKALAAFKRARPIAEKAVLEGPTDSSRHVILGMILAGLGEKDGAIAEGRRAVELLPESQDALDGPKTTVALAQIYAWTGETDQALQLIDRSLSTPNGVTIPSLSLDPMWDPLRDDPRFQALIDRYAAKA
ncbi:MAG: tetratricopeptide repeat protein, partial [Candidatus Udaeobacter sp.]